MNSSSEITPTNKANHTGNNLEVFIERTLQDHGYTPFPNHKDQLFNNRKSVGGKQYGKQIPCGETIYETLRKCDFLVLNKDKFPDGLIIECKWQQSTGTVDEKYPYVIHNILKTGIPTIVLLDGNGYKKKAKEWLLSYVKDSGALIGVYSMSEFQTKVNNGFLS